MTDEGSLELKSLRLLVMVGTLGSLGQAARAHGMSQPAASKRIAKLEQALGLPLLTRSPRGSELTTDGIVVADWSRRALHDVDLMLGAVSSLRRDRDAGLRIAASMSVAEHLAPAWLYQLQRLHPDLHVGLQVANSQEVQVRVVAGDVDIGFIESPDIDGRLESQTVARDRLAVVVPPLHPWATRRPRRLTRDQLRNTALIVREPGSGTRATLDHLLGSDDSAVPLLELGSNEAVKGAVLAGAGPAVLSVLAVAAEVGSGRLVALDIDDLDLGRELSAVWLCDNKPSGPCQALLQTARKLGAASSDGRRPDTRR